MSSFQKAETEAEAEEDDFLSLSLSLSLFRVELTSEKHVNFDKQREVNWLFIAVVSAKRWRRSRHLLAFTIYTVERFLKAAILVLHKWYFYFAVFVKEKLRLKLPNPHNSSNGAQNATRDSRSCVSDSARFTFTRWTNRNGWDVPKRGGKFALN